MNARYLLVMLVAIALSGIVLTSRSTLGPQRGVDHVFYGDVSNDNLAEHVAIGDFNGDGLDDIITSIAWDDPDAATYLFWPDSVWNCSQGWTLIYADSAGRDTVVCNFSGANAQEHREFWASKGWNVDSTSSDCGECWSYEYANKEYGAVLIYQGSTTLGWSAKQGSKSSADMVVYGENGGDKLLSVSSGDVNGDGKDDFVLGAAGGERVYVLHGGATLPNAVDLSVASERDSVKLYFHGRESGDGFGAGLAVGDLFNGDGGNEDIVIAAPGSDDGPNGEDSGLIYVFYGVDSLPAVVDLADSSDASLAGFATLIHGPFAGAGIGVTSISSHVGNHGYDAVGLAIGDWNGDGFEDLAIGAGNHPDSAAVYVIFGGDSDLPTTNKLKPGNNIDLSNAPSANLDAPDIVIWYYSGAGDSTSFGAGVAFVDADSSAGPANSLDLIIGAPQADHPGGGSPESGAAYIIFGATQNTLTGTRLRNVDNTADWDVLILGENTLDQLGGYFAGGFNRDIDGDGANDIGISGKQDNYVIFGHRAWEDTLDLKTMLDSFPDARVIKYTETELDSTHSATIRFAHLDSGNDADLVFGGYDYHGIANEPNAGQMWVARGKDIWKSGNITANATWSGVTFVHGDINVAQGTTLTIDAGTDVWIWPKDPDPSDDVGESYAGYPDQMDSTRVEFRVYGSLVVNGTEAAPVRFLAWTTDSTTTEARDKWWGIHIHEASGASASFNYCEVRNAVRGIQSNAPMEIRNSVIEHCDILGVSVAGPDSIYIADTKIRNIGYIGLNMLDSMRVRLERVSIDHVDEYGIACYKDARLYARNDTIRDATIAGMRVGQAGGQSAWADIDSCTFENNVFGLKVDYTSNVTVDVSTFDGNIVGIACNWDSQIATQNNVIKNNYDGVYLSLNSDASILGSLIRDNTVGIEYDAADGSVEDNDIIYNYIGIATRNGADPDVGHSSGGNSLGNNEIHHSTLYHVSNENSSGTIMAENNYWKNSISPCLPAAGKINGSVDSYPALCSAPASSRYAGEGAVAAVPTTWRMHQNYPNPFNPTTTVKYDVPAGGGRVRIAIYNVRGQLVRTVLDAWRGPGFYTEQWNGVDNRGEHVSSGVYYMQLRTDKFVTARKLVLLK